MGFSNTAAFIGTLGGTLYRVDFEAARWQATRRQIPGA